jgi:glutamine synthetase
MRVLEYIWIDGYNTLRSKTRVLKNEVVKVEEIPEWNYDGSSTNQASGDNSEIILKPVYLCADPFRLYTNSITYIRGSHVKFGLVLCETYNIDGTPTSTNKRHNALEVFEKYSSEEPMFGIEQEFFISVGGKPIGFTEDAKPQKDYYCGVGGDNVCRRDVIEEAFQNCLKGGLNLTGLNAEVAPSQWEFQVCAIGINAADQLIMLRYITNRTLEKHGYNMDISPKPMEGDWNGSGCHVNFSTQIMRDAGGLEHIIKGITKLGEHHSDCMLIYGDDNERRLTGLHETSDYNSFSYGVANRGASVRIPRDTEKNKCGYFEDRRPSSNMDPYLVTSAILEFIH